MDAVRKALEELRESDEKREEEIRGLKADVENIRVMIPKMLDKQKESQLAIITDLQSEVKSLKNLLLNRRIPMTGSGSGSIGNGSIPNTSFATLSNVSDDGADSVSSSSVGGGSPASAAAAPASTSLTQGLLAGRFGKPAIPAWQLEASGGSNASDGKSASEE
ncbi:hypothetical protein HK102_009671 [Quaeritorhiza haematococci]|nr:hypothetical protein HK102_009671 [Quaeritorhiza haematococci]